MYADFIYIYVEFYLFAFAASSIVLRTSAQIFQISPIDLIRLP